MLETYKNLFEYNAWANGNIIDIVSKLSAEDFTKVHNSTFPSIRDTLIHIVSAERAWLDRWNGLSPASPVNPDDLPTPGALRVFWEKLVAGQEDFLSRLSGNEFGERKTIINFKGKLRSYTLWQMIMHVICHSNYHRGEINTMLHSTGAAPVPTDMLAYHDEREKDGIYLDTVPFT